MSAAAIASAFPGTLRTVRPANVAGATLDREDPRLVSAFYSLAAGRPADSFKITSGARTRQPASSPYPIAEQGHSLHDPGATGTGMGEALDALVNGQPAANVIGANELALYGLQAPVPGDPVHLTLQGWNG